MKTSAKSIKMMIITGIAIAALCIAGVIYYLHTPSGMIAIDVNPSLEIHTNRLGEVVSIDPVNDDAKQLMAGYQITDRNLETVIKDIVDRMILNGYLVNSDTDQILISTDKNTNSDELLNQVTTSVNSYLQEKQLVVQVLDQKVDMDKEDIEAAHENQVSVGKMAIINKIMENSSDLTVKELTHISVKKLIQYAVRYNVSLEELIRNYSTALANLTVSPTAAATPTPTGVTEATPTPAEDGTAAVNTIIISTGKEDTEKDVDVEDADDQGEDDEDADIENESEDSDIKDSKESEHVISGKEDSEDKDSDSDEEDYSKKTSVKRTSDADAVSGATVNISKEDNSDSDEDYDYEDGEEDNDLQEDEDQGNEVRDREDQDDDRQNNEDSYNNWQDDQGEDD